MKHIAMIVGGVALAMAGLWGSSYAMELFPFGQHWANFPAFMTGLIVMFVGFAIAAAGFVGRACK